MRKTGLIFTCLILVLIAVSYVFGQTKPDTTRKAPTPEQLMNQARAEFLRNDSLIAKLQDRNKFLQGYWQALSDQEALKSDTMKVDPPKKK